MQKRRLYAHRDAMRMRQRALVAEAVARRLDLGLSQRDVGQEVNVHQSAVSEMESIVDPRVERSITLDTFMAYLDAVGLRLRIERS